MSCLKLSAATMDAPDMFGFVILRANDSHGLGFLPCTTFMFEFHVYDFDSYSHFDLSEEQEEDAASSADDGYDRSSRMLYLPHEGPPLRRVILAKCGDLNDKLTWSRIVLQLSKWGIIEQYRKNILDGISRHTIEIDADDFHPETARRIRIYISIKRVVSFWSNLDRSSGEVDPSRNDVMSALDQMKEDDCPICMNGLAGSNAAELLPCGHIIHAHCLSEWLWRNESCPLCRHIVSKERF